MTNSIESAVVNALPVSEIATEAELIATAKSLNASTHFHLKKSAEDFWRMGEVLTDLYERPSVQGRWRQVLKEIGVNHTTENQARRLYAVTTLEALTEYRNKTAALRALGLLAEAIPAKKETPDRATKKVQEPAGKTTTAEVSQSDTIPTMPEAGREETNDAEDRATPIEKGAGAKRAAKKSEPAPSADQDTTPLEVLTQIAARLDYLIKDEIEITPEIVVQIDRAAKALDWLREKGVVHAAA